jgi:hypothetical protein
VNNDELWGGDPDTDYPCNFEAEILAVSGISSYLKRPLPALSPEIVGYPKKLYPQIKKFYPKNLQRCQPIPEPGIPTGRRLHR